MGLEAFDALVAAQHHKVMEVQMRAKYLVRGMARSFNGRTLGSQSGDRGSIPLRVIHIGSTARWWNRQTRGTQNAEPMRRGSSSLPLATQE